MEILLSYLLFIDSKTTSLGTLHNNHHLYQTSYLKNWMFKIIKEHKRFFQFSHKHAKDDNKDDDDDDYADDNDQYNVIPSSVSLNSFYTTTAHFRLLSNPFA